MAYRSFSPSKFEARGARKVTNNTVHIASKMQRQTSQQTNSSSYSSYHTSQNASEDDESDPPGGSQVRDPVYLLGSHLVHADVNQERRLAILESGELSEILGKHRAKGTPNGWCLEHNLAPTKEGGYAQISIRGHKDFSIIHLVAWESGALGYQRKMELNDTLAEQAQASHLCGNRKCIQVGHVIWETVQMNNDRKGCLAYLELENGKLVPICRHRPVCIHSMEGKTFDSIYRREPGGQIGFNIDDRWEHVAKKAGASK